MRSAASVHSAFSVLNERLDLPTRQLESLIAKRRQHPTRVFQELLPEVFVGEHAADKELHGLL
jgi:hypothetical protein